MSTILVKVGKSLKQGKTLIDAASGDWMIAPKKIGGINKVIAVENAEIRGEFKVNGYSRIPTGPKKGRYCFDLQEEKTGIKVPPEYLSCRCSVRYLL